MPKKAKQEPQESQGQQASKMDPKVKEAVDSHMDNMMKLVLTSLADCLGSDLSFYDVSYISRRIIQLLEESYRKVDFTDNELSRLRKEFYLRKALEISKSITVPTDFPTDSREAKCEPVCHKIIGELANGDFLFNDSKWIDQFIDAQNGASVMDMFKHYADLLASKMDFSLGHSMSECDRILFGKPKNVLMLKDMDRIMKSVKKEPLITEKDTI